MSSPSKTPWRSRFALLRPAVFHLIFWAWNAVFLSVASLGITPLVGAAVVAEVLGDFGTLSLAIAALLVVVVPAAATLAGFLWLRRDATRLIRFFYGVEAPLFVLALFRLFLIRELTGGVAAVLLVLVIGVAAYGYRLFRGAEEVHPWRVLLALAGDTVGLWIGVYVAGLLAFFAVPTGWMTLRAFLRFRWLTHGLEAIWDSPALALFLVPSFFLLLFTSGTLFAALPPALVALYARRFRTGVRSARARLGVIPVALTIAGTSIVLLLGLVTATRQSQRTALSLLATPPADDAARRARLALAGNLREGLTSAYLAPFHYLGSTENALAVKDLWSEELGFESAGPLDVQKAFSAVAGPFLYDGDLRDPARQVAADHYKAFFDRSIQRGEKGRIVSAVEATFSQQGREAGLLTEGGRKVFVASQDVRIVEEQQDVAEIEVHEAYENRTGDPQEVFYFFSLPETAAVTGLWLGETDDRAAASAFTISPRGAAQRVYRAEVAVRRDPALLEQIGPRQYRLRAFPIPPRTVDRSKRSDIPLISAGRSLHLWLRYRALASNGSFPLPHLLEERNAFRDRGTRRSIGGHSTSLKPDVWLPASLPATAASQPVPHSVRIGGEANVLAVPEPPPSALPAGKRLAVVLDRSFSMGEQASGVVSAIAWTRKHVLPGNEVHLVLTAASTRGEPPRRLDDLSAFDPKSVIYYGGQDPAELLEQLAALRGDVHYDGIVVLTDGGGFDLVGPKREAKDLGAPIWMVHLGGQLAAGYDDATLETIQRNGGGAVTTVEEAFARLAAKSLDPADLGWADGYRFRLAPASNVPPDAFGAIAARRFIVGTARAPGVLGLDAVHALAKEHGVVTPYSSMIVLVNDAQRKALEAAEKQDDRFQRDVENGETQIRPVRPPLTGSVTGTPEPSEWILLALSASGLGLVARLRRRLKAKQRGSSSRR